MNEKNNSGKNIFSTLISKINSGPIKFNKNKLITVLTIIVTLLIKIFIPSGCDDTGTMCYNRFHFFETIATYVLLILIGYLIINIIKDFITHSEKNKKIIE